MSKPDPPGEAGALEITGILETALYCANAAAAAVFYRALFGFPVLLESERLVALDVAGRNVLLLFAAGHTEAPFQTVGGTVPPHGPGGPTHLALSIPAGAFDAWIERLAAAGIPVESTVNWSGGSRSIYFRDPDANLVELMTPGFWTFPA